MSASGEGGGHPHQGGSAQDVCLFAVPQLSTQTEELVKNGAGSGSKAWTWGLASVSCHHKYRERSRATPPVMAIRELLQLACLQGPSPSRQSASGRCQKET